MNLSLLAAAGLQDCVDAGMDDCMPGFGGFLLASGLVLVGVLVWLPLAVHATTSVVLSPTGVLRGVGWVAAIWVIPLLGVVAWWVSERRKTLGSESDFQ